MGVTARPRGRRLRAQGLAAGLAAALTLTAACGGDGDDGAVPAPEFKTISAASLPAQVLGLTVASEEFSTAQLPADQQPYIDELGLFSFRRGDLLQATLQVARFSDDVTVDSAFQGQLAAQVGNVASPTVVRVGDQRVYLASGGRQTIAIWFHDGRMHVLSIREEYPTPRALLRELTDLEIDR